MKKEEEQDNNKSENIKLKRTFDVFGRQGDMFDENTYLVMESFRNENDEIIKGKIMIIDPGIKNIDSLIELTNETGLTVSAILLTHAHVDHILGLDKIKEHFPEAVVVAPSFEAKRINDKSYTLARFNVNTKIDYEVLEENSKDIKVGDSHEIIIDNIPITFISTPGHTKGSATIVYNNQFIFTGDTLFKNGYGRCDLKTGNVDDMNNSLKYLFATFKDDATFFPGHGEISTFGEEKEYYDLIY